MSGNILLLGDPRLRETCGAVEDFCEQALSDEIRRLEDELDAFRREHGFGRAVAAPQIGIQKRIIALNLGKGTFVIFNPEITMRSAGTFTLWDDCMSFPDLMVKVERHASISMTWQDETGSIHRWENMERPESELLQHEIDHLDGILAVDRAIHPEGIIYRKVFEDMRGFFDSQVDYVIGSPEPGE